MSSSKAASSKAVQKALAGVPQLRQYDPAQRQAVAQRFLNRLAKAYGGECLSRYKDALSILTLRCAKGHRWKASYDSLRRGHWCGRCGHEARQVGLERIQRLAAQRGGECLSKRYKGVLDEIEFVCKKGHKFLLAPTKLIGPGQWCSQCTIDDRRDEGL